LPGNFVKHNIVPFYFAFCCTLHIASWQSVLFWLYCVMKQCYHYSCVFV